MRMETPKKSDSMNDSEHLSTPSSSMEKKGAVVTPGSSDRKGECVKEPHDNDVLCGRGGSINSHKGNERFRSLVEKRKRVYLTARFKREKRLIANSIVSEIRSLDPPGRFLTRDSKSSLWCDIGDDKARDKTSQALRENAPSIRAEIEVEINQQRAEMAREEEEVARAHATAHHHGHQPHSHQYPHGPPHHYYRQPWGYYAPYHGYGQYSQPEPQAPPSYDGGHGRHSSYSYHGSSGPPPQRSPTSVTSRRGGAGGHFNRRSHDQDDHHHHQADDSSYYSAFDVPKFVSTVADWTKNSFSFSQAHSSDDQSVSSRHSNVSRYSDRPIAYVHHGQEDRRSVRFEDDHRHGHSSHHHHGRPHHSSHYRRQHPPSSAGAGGAPHGYYDYTPPRHHNQAPPPPAGQQQQQQPPISRNNSIITSDLKAPASSKRAGDSIEPYGHPAQTSETEPSLLTQVTNHILGSWDTNMVCANDSTDENEGTATTSKPAAGTSTTASLFTSSSMCSSADYVARHEFKPVSLADAMEDDEEGQEVELADMIDYEEESAATEPAQSGSGGSRKGDDGAHREDDEARMPPPESRTIQIDWPAKMMGGCQTTWLPETFQHGSAFFSSPRNAPSRPLSPTNSIEMDESAVGTEGISYTGSIGGGSLLQVFSNEEKSRAGGGGSGGGGGTGGDGASSFRGDRHQMITQMPSWERSFRSKSPSTICSDDGEQQKLSGQLSPLTTPPSPRLTAPLSPGNSVSGREEYMEDLEMKE